MTRRSLLSRAGLASAGAVAGLPLAAAAAAPNSTGSTGGRKLKIVVAGGHPGDPEYGCGGTAARLADLGHEVTLLYLNEGDWEDILATTRLAEARAACEILKTRPAYAGQKNGHAIVDEPHYEEFGKILLAEKTGRGLHAMADRQSPRPSRYRHALL